MPEIAEVETVRQTLKRRILKKQIKNVNVLYERMIESDLTEFKTKLVGLEFDDILRYFACNIDKKKNTITLYKVLYNLIYEDTGKYDVEIPDTIHGMSVVISDT